MKIPTGKRQHNAMVETVNVNSGLHVHHCGKRTSVWHFRWFKNWMSLASPGSMSSLGSSRGSSLLQVPGALPTISHATLGSGRSARPMICLSTSQSMDRHSPHRVSASDSVEGCRFTPAHRVNRHRLNSAHSIDGYRFSPAHRMSRHRLSSAHSMDGYRLNPDHCSERPPLTSSHSIDRHPSLRLSPTHSGRPPHWLSPQDSLDRNKLSPSYVPERAVLKRPASFHTSSRQLRRQVGSLFIRRWFWLMSLFFISTNQRL